jgi:molybdopterin converting factor small subunit
MPSLRIPTPLRAYTAGQSEINLQGQTAGEVLNDLITQHPGLKPHLFNEEGTLRPFVNLFLGEDNINELQGLDTPIKETDRLLIIPSIAGGRI